MELNTLGNGTIDLEEFLKWTEYAWEKQALGLNRDAHSKKLSPQGGKERRGSFANPTEVQEAVVEEAEEEEEA